MTPAEVNRLTFWEFTALAAGIDRAQRRAEGKGATMSDEDFEEGLAAIRAMGMADVKV